MEDTNKAKFKKLKVLDPDIGAEDIYAFQILSEILLLHNFRFFQEEKRSQH